MEKQIDFLIRENEELKKRIQELEEENKSLWFMLDEFENSRDSMGVALEDVLKEKLEDEYFKSLKPIGDA
jgi:regulator of replication initiation timing